MGQRVRIAQLAQRLDQPGLDDGIVGRGRTLVQPRQHRADQTDGIGAEGLARRARLIGIVQPGQHLGGALPHHRLGGRRQMRHHRQRIAARRVTRIAQGLRILHQPDLVDRAHRRHLVQQHREHRLRIKHPRIGALPGVHQREALHRHIGLAIQHQRIGRATQRRHVERNAPMHRLALRGRSGGVEPVLRQMQALLGRRHADQRHAGLGGEIMLDGKDGLSGHLLQHAPQIGVHRAAIAMGAHIALHASTEGIGPHIVGQHGDDRRALVIGDVIKSLRRLIGGGDLLQNGMGRGLGIGIAPILEEGLGLEPGLPFGVEHIGGMDLHPARETLVEPEIVPPVHRHQIAEPLMRHLMRDDGKDTLAVGLGRAGGVEQQAGLRIEDGAPILHGIALKRAGRGNQIQLGQRIGRAEPAIVEMQQSRRLIERIGALGTVPALDHHADIDAIDLAMNALQIAHAKEEQIARHARAWREGDAVHVRRQSHRARHRHVR